MFAAARAAAPAVIFLDEADAVAPARSYSAKSGGGGDAGGAAADAAARLVATLLTEMDGGAAGGCPHFVRSMPLATERRCGKPGGDAGPGNERHRRKHVLL